MKNKILKNNLGDKARRFHSPYDKIVSDKVAVSRVRSWKSRGFRVVIVDAVLDIPHYRHADYFLACANLGDKNTLRRVNIIEKRSAWANYILGRKS